MEAEEEEIAKEVNHSRSSVEPSVRPQVQIPSAHVETQAIKLMPVSPFCGGSLVFVG